MATQTRKQSNTAPRHLKSPETPKGASRQEVTAAHRRKHQAERKRPRRRSNSERLYYEKLLPYAEEQHRGNQRALHTGVGWLFALPVVLLVIVALLSFYYAVTRSPILSLRGRSEVFRFSRSAVRKALTISSPLALQQIFMGGAQIISTIIVAPLGNIAIAANTFAITVESLCYMPGYGIGDAAQTLTGQSLGAGRAALCRSFARRTVGLGMIVMAAMGALMYIFAPEMLGLITPDAGIRALGTGALRIEAFADRLSLPPAGHALPLLPERSCCGLHLGHWGAHHPGKEPAECGRAPRHPPDSPARHAQRRIHLDRR